MTLCKWVLFTAMIVTSAPVFSAPDSTTDRLKNLDELIQKAKDAFDIPSGTSIAIVKDDRIVYQGAFGYADIKGNRLVTDDTSFYIASSTKPFFALATLLKEHEGAISENTSLQALFPGLKFAYIDAEKVTVKHLLTHTMGFDNSPMELATAYTGLHDYQLRRQLVAASYPDEESALDNYRYSNIGYNVVSVWFDQQYPQGWQNVLQQAVFSPLEMKHTSAIMSDVEQPGWSIAEPYFYFSDDKNEKLYLSKKDNTMHAAGGMVASAHDIGRFLIAQLNAGKVDGKQVFPAAVIHKSQQQQTSFKQQYGDYERFGYAWGWNLNLYKDLVMHSHFGGFAGTSAHISYVLEKDIGVVVINNEGSLYGNKSLTGLMVSTIYDTLLLPDDHTPEQLARISENFNVQLKELVEAFDKINVKVAEGKTSRAARPWKLSLSKASYSGIYSHPLAGKIHIVLDEQQNMHVSWGNMHAVATPFKYQDSVRLELSPGQGRTITFNISDNKVQSLVYDGLEFSRT
jgi:CubicO group peptidase (beta-lactamase class C family)